MNFQTSINDYQNCQDFQNIVNYRRLFQKSHKIDIFKCIPLYMRNRTEEEKQEYYNQWGFSSLIHPTENKEIFKDLLNNIKLNKDDFTRLGKKGGTNKNIIQNYINLVKWYDLEIITQHQSHERTNLINKINKIALNSYNESINTYIFDSYLLLCSYDEIIYIHDVREATREGRTFVNPEYITNTSSRHKNLLLLSLYENDLLSTYINL